eukprot:scaffold8431_cov248-Pinguiococcus_pyrenoidosus.AAC.5
MQGGIGESDEMGKRTILLGPGEGASAALPLFSFDASNLNEEPLAGVAEQGSEHSLKSIGWIGGVAVNPDSKGGVAALSLEERRQDKPSFVLFAPGTVGHWARMAMKVEPSLRQTRSRLHSLDNAQQGGPELLVDLTHEARWKNAATELGRRVLGHRFLQKVKVPGVHDRAGLDGLQIDLCLGSHEGFHPEAMPCRVNLFQPLKRRRRLLPKALQSLLISTREGHVWHIDLPDRDQFLQKSPEAHEVWVKLWGFVLRKNGTAIDPEHFCHEPGVQLQLRLLEALLADYSELLRLEDRFKSFQKRRQGPLLQVREGQKRGEVAARRLLRLPRHVDV